MRELEERDISSELSPSWAESFSSFLSDHTNLGPGSIDKYVGVIRTLMGKRSTFSMVAAARYSKQKNRHYVRTAIMRFVDWLQYIGAFTELQVARFEQSVPKVIETQARPRDLPTEDELWSIIEYMDPEYRAVARFMTMTGARVGEAVSVKLKDIDFETGTVTLYGKGRIQKKPRTVRLPVEYLELIKKHLGDLGILDGEYIFLTESKASPASKVKAFDAKFGKACIKVLGRTIGSHDIRRFVGTKIYSTTRDLQLTQRALGHSDIRTTQIYTKYADLEKDLNTIRDILGKKSSGG